MSFNMKCYAFFYTDKNCITKIKRKDVFIDRKIKIFIIQKATEIIDFSSKILFTLHGDRKPITFNNKIFAILQICSRPVVYMYACDHYSAVER